jgi:hypothetical protein
MNPTDADERIVAVLAPLHAGVNARHAGTRTSLLAAVANEPLTPIRPRVKRVRWRYLVGSLSVSAAAAIAFVLWLVSGTSPAAAMERMAQALNQVSSYSYRMDKTYISHAGKGRKVRQITHGGWRTSPAALRAAIHIGETVGTGDAAPETGKVLVDLFEAHDANKGGIVIDHLKQEYWYVNQKLDASSIPPSSPQVAIHMVQQRRGRVLRDLGKKTLHGQPARGLEIELDGAQPVSELGPTVPDQKDGEPAEIDWRNTRFVVWIDRNTNLPIEFSCSRRGADFETYYVFNNLNWNVVFAEDEFTPTPPAGYSQRGVEKNEE